MLMTKRYEYLPTEMINVHPDIINHRALDLRKVNHYEGDILKNGLLEPLVAWEKKTGEYYLVGGFHRMAAISAIRQKNPGYFDRVDVRVVSGELDEMRALNLKLNADRLDAKIVDYFDAVIYLTNANWDRERIAGFIDKSVSWIDDIIRYVPGMDGRVRKLLEDGKISWSKAKNICRAVQDAPAGQEKETLARELQALGLDGEPAPVKKKPLTFRTVKSRLSAYVQTHPAATYTVKAEDLLYLMMVLEGKQYEDTHIERVRSIFPGLME